MPPKLEARPASTASEYASTSESAHAAPHGWLVQASRSRTRAWRTASETAARGRAGCCTKAPRATNRAPRRARVERRALRVLAVAQGPPRSSVTDWNAGGSPAAPMRFESWSRSPRRNARRATARSAARSSAKARSSAASASAYCDGSCSTSTPSVLRRRQQRDAADVDLSIIPASASATLPSNGYRTATVDGSRSRCASSGHVGRRVAAREDRRARAGAASSRGRRAASKPVHSSSFETGTPASASAVAVPLPREDQRAVRRARARSRQRPSVGETEQRGRASGSASSRRLLLAPSGAVNVGCSTSPVFRVPCGSNSMTRPPPPRSAGAPRRAAPRSGRPATASPCDHGTPCRTYRARRGTSRRRLGDATRGPRNFATFTSCSFSRATTASGRQCSVTAANRGDRTSSSFISHGPDRRCTASR